jgi:hypothetical protein
MLAFQETPEPSSIGASWELARSSRSLAEIRLTQKIQNRQPIQVSDLVRDIASAVELTHTPAAFV